MMDVNGDGLPDQVLRVPTAGTYVKLNRSGKAGLLKGIRLPQGGKYTLEYDDAGNTTDMPQHRYVLVRVEKDDNEDTDKVDRSGHVYATDYAYEDGYYDRTEKEFYGFGKVTTRYADESVTVVEYHNKEYYSAGMERERNLYDDSGRQMHKTVNTVDPVYPRIINILDRIYDEVNGNYIEKEQTFKYDDYGNVKKYDDTGDGPENEQHAVITYAPVVTPGGSVIYNRPARIEVRGSGGAMRIREGVYDSNGALKEWRQYYEAGKYLGYRYEYNEYGMMTLAEDAAGVRLCYEYDSGTRQYLTRVRQEDGGGSGYESVIEWDTDRGLKKSEEDANEKQIRYEYDSRGRLEKVFTGYDGETPAAEYRYVTGNRHWYAVTGNKVSFDADDTGVMLTVVELDGLGRVRRTAKSGEKYEEGEPVRGWNVSGAVEYDNKGRTVRAGQTYFVKTADGEAGIKALLKAVPEMLRATETEYDQRDRAVKVTLPDNSATSTYYGIKYLNGKLRQVTE
jgi:hypothetical protein